MRNLITQIIECNDAREVDRIVERNLYLVNGNERAKLVNVGNRAKVRIFRIAQEKKRSWSDLVN
jgi:hypothetical protein